MLQKLMLRFLNPIPGTYKKEFTSLVLRSNIKRLSRLNNILLLPLAIFILIELQGKTQLVFHYTAAFCFNLICMPFFLKRRSLGERAHKLLLVCYSAFYYVVIGWIVLAGQIYNYGINLYIILIIASSLIITLTVSKNCALYLFLALSFIVLQPFFQKKLHIILSNSNMVFITSLISFFIARYFYKAKLKSFLHKKKMQSQNTKLNKSAKKRRQAIKALKISEKRFITILQSVNDGIWEHYLTENGQGDQIYKTLMLNSLHSRKIGIKELYYSPGVFSMLGCTIPELHKAPELLHSLMHFEDRLRSAALFLEISRDQIDTYDEIFRYKHTSGIYRFIRVRLMCLSRSKEGVPLRIVGIHTDVTRLKEYELELTKLNSEKNTLFSIIAHDLRSPLSGMSQLLSFILNHKGLLTENEVFGLLDDAHASLENTRNLVENLLDWSRSQSNNIFFNPEEIHIHSALQQITSLYALAAGEKDIEIINRIDDTYYVNADRKMFHTIFRNLISNSIKFTGKDGKITIQAKPEAGNVTLSVTDNGIGMTEQEKADLFSLSNKWTKRGTEGERGSGLGLILCKEFTERHGGNIEVTSKKNEGTVFHVTLPVLPDYAG